MTSHPASTLGWAAFAAPLRVDTRSTRRHLVLSYVMRIEEVVTRTRVVERGGKQVTLEEQVRTPEFLRKYHQGKPTVVAADA